MVTHRHAGHALTNLHHNAAALVPQHGWEHAFWVITAQSVGVGMAHGGMGDFDHHLARLWRRDIDFNDL